MVKYYKLKDENGDDVIGIKEDGIIFFHSISKARKQTSCVYDDIFLEEDKEIVEITFLEILFEKERMLNTIIDFEGGCSNCFYRVNCGNEFYSKRGTQLFNELKNKLKEVNLDD